MGGVTPRREPQWQGSRTPVAMATGGRTPAWGAGGSSARSMSPTPVIFPPTNDHQHQLGPPMPPQPEPPCGAKTLEAPMAVVAHPLTMPVATALEP